MMNPVPPSVLAELADLYEASVSEAYDLNYLVLAEKAEEAREINLDGLTAQLEYLIARLGAADVREEIEALAAAPEPEGF